MGVPAFFKWLSLRYPKILIDAEEHIEDANQINIEDDAIAIDNLYIDLNGIVHPCSHPEDRPQPQSEAEMFNNIFEYLDRVIKLTKPQQILYLALDGVAPRAKMNQQRSRRFRTALDSKLKKNKEETLKKEFEKGNKKPLINTTPASSFDSNVITPGTPFMTKLSKALTHYIYDRMNNHYLWTNLTVIFSDSQAPGEGEHKILEFIRKQRAQPGYNPNITHCIHGADADLIMLALATHEAHFYILREVVLLPYEKYCHICRIKGHNEAECNGGKKKLASYKIVPFQYINIAVIREYLRYEFEDIKLPFELNFENIIDDFVFVCFFVGNDFLPNLPSLYIREGAIDAIMHIYKALLPELGGYVSNSGELSIERMNKLFEKIGLLEELLIKAQKQKALKEGKSNRSPTNFVKPKPEEMNKKIFAKIEIKHSKSENSKNDDKEEKSSPLVDHNILKLDAGKEIIINNFPEEVNVKPEDATSKMDIKKQVEELVRNDALVLTSQYVDRVKLGEEGYKQRYYLDKFHIKLEDQPAFLKEIRKHYIDGLKWVFAYYYKGCPSWSWFYPYHYSPFASDLLDTSLVCAPFVIAKPFLPFQQLMAVLPPASGHCLPKCLQELIQDKTSEIADFYPEYFEVDINGQRYPWMGVNLLPFIDETRLLKAIIQKNNYSEEEAERNRFGDSYFFIRLNNPMSPVNIGNKGKISFGRGNVLSGEYDFTVVKYNKLIYKPVKSLKLNSIKENNVYCSKFTLPDIKEHKCAILHNAKFDSPKVSRADMQYVDRFTFNGEVAIEYAQLTLDPNFDTLKNLPLNFGDKYNNFNKYYNNNRSMNVGPMTGKRPRPGEDERVNLKSKKVEGIPNPLIRQYLHENQGK